METRGYRFNDVFPALIPLGKSKGREMIREGRLAVKREGRAVIIPRSSIDAYYASEVESAKVKGSSR